ncbi:DUF7674 family protein [Endothiovibrio diazotrophicus]
MAPCARPRRSAPIGRRRTAPRDAPRGPHGTGKGVDWGQSTGKRAPGVAPRGVADNDPFSKKRPSLRTGYGPRKGTTADRRPRGANIRDIGGTSCNLLNPPWYSKKWRAEVRNCIDVAFTENLFWQVKEENATPHWELLPSNLRDLHVGFHGRTPLRRLSDYGGYAGVQVLIDGL